MSASELRAEKERRLKGRYAERWEELQGLLPQLPEATRRKAMIEQKLVACPPPGYWSGADGKVSCSCDAIWQAVALQRKVRYEVAAEQRLQELCSGPHPPRLLDWGLMRLRRADVAASLARWELRGTQTAHQMAEMEERQRRRRRAEMRARQEVEERAREALARARFSAELANAVREVAMLAQASVKRRKQRNDGVLAWHVKQRARATRAERLRVQALKAGDQEAYLRLVEESKNERLKTLLSTTDSLLQRLGSMVQVQKDLVHGPALRPPPTPKPHSPPPPAAAASDAGAKADAAAAATADGDGPEHRREENKEGEEDAGAGAGEGGAEGGQGGAGAGTGEEGGMLARDLMEGERRYSAAVHAVEESVTVQPASLAGGGTLREYQVEGLQWMLSLYNNNMNGILADEMGLGKTIQTIALLAYLHERKGNAGPHLVLAPKAVLPNWAHEFATWLPTMKVVVYDGKADDRRAIREEYGGEGKFNVMITHYDLIMRDKAFLKKITWSYLIVDEGHRLKNHESMLARTLVSGLVACPPPGYWSGADGKVSCSCDAIWQAVALQRKVRYEVAAEQRLQELCSGPHPPRLLDWGLMRLRRADVAASLARWELRGTQTAHQMAEMEERQRRRRRAEMRARQEVEERAREALARARFSAELANAVREVAMLAQASVKRRKQRNDGVLAWHVKQRARATRAERLRVQALKAGDQEAYLRLVEESKNERLKTLLSTTDSLLQRLGSMVQVQKDLVHGPALRPPPTPKPHSPPPPAAAASDAGAKADAAAAATADGDGPEHRREENKEGEEDAGAGAGEGGAEGGQGGAGAGTGEEGGMLARDLMEGERRYSAAVHAVEESVTVQPASLAGGGTLREYQVEGLQWMLSLYNNNMNGILADEMGLGKTIQTIALLAYLHERKGNAGPHLVLAPKAVLPNWAHEFATWLPTMKVVVYDGKADDRRAIREEYGGEGKFNVMITHYDLIMRDKAFLKKITWSYLIVDEGHRLKNHESMLARTLVSGYHIRRRLLLTGTPIQNSLAELWSLLNFLLPAIFNSSSKFEEWFNAPFADKAEVALNEEEELLVIRRLHQVIRPFLLRRKKAEVEKYLPQKTQVILKCDLSAWQRAYYAQILADGRVGLVAPPAGTSGRSRTLQNSAMQLRKVCNHPYLFLDRLGYEPAQRAELVRASGKFLLLDRLLPKLRAAGHRILLFSQMTRLMDVLEDFLEWRGFRYLRLDGNTKTEERGELLRRFNADGSDVFMFLLSTRAGGLGLNLQTADTVILFDSDWNPQMDQQAEDRAHRIGQKKEVRVFVLVSVGSIEEEILERAKTKMGIDAKVIQAGLFNTTSTATERRQMLEEIMRRGTSALGSDVPSDTEINRLTARTPQELELYEQMDREREREEEEEGMHASERSTLMREDEVPAWAFLREGGVDDGVGAAAKAGAEAGGGDPTPAGAVDGKRRRSQTVYADALTESQWLKVVEEGGSVEDMVRQKKEKELRRRQRKNHKEAEQGSQREPAGGGSVDGAMADEEEEEGEGEEDRAVRGTGRGGAGAGGLEDEALEGGAREEGPLKKRKYARVVGGSMRGLQGAGLTVRLSPAVSQLGRGVAEEEEEVEFDPLATPLDNEEGEAEAEAEVEGPEEGEKRPYSGKKRGRKRKKSRAPAAAAAAGGDGPQVGSGDEGGEGAGQRERGALGRPGAHSDRRVVRAVGLLVDEVEEAEEALQVGASTWEQSVKKRSNRRKMPGGGTGKGGASARSAGGGADEDEDEWA
eukprot:jgi/Mesen1/1326/ME000013S00815